MNLYKLTIIKPCQGNSFYIAADDPTQAETALADELEVLDWWFYKDRKVVSIELIANTINEKNHVFQEISR